MKKITTWQTALSPIVLLSAALGMSAALASTQGDVNGLWLTEEGDAVIEVEECPDRLGSLCGTIVWDVDAGTPTDTCGARVIQLDEYSDGAWRNGWVYDPRKDKTYKGKLSADGNELDVRAFIGVAVLGETEHLTRTERLPKKPACRK
ncbi:hypothetical protein ADIMK_1829 [Marinobacterium lacunae]|uniref:DUF2147 domain-containing protein n=1 Tax=Marinobacterium lacunae TaxID=1232683 RepID=A0A081FZY9_9GAMM|nr:DUF2147 domain-containing protein [Marinobacterium lacunae]KEA64094.1 hypothetical protein ADIMK_1829 [Marinobacterium lacunae]